MDDNILNIKRLIDSGNLDEAERALTNALEQNPDSQELLNIQAELSLKLGSTFWEKGDVEKALELKTLLLLFLTMGGVERGFSNKSL
jgi:predicted negative regulator of RcsB-dependent stress response